MRAERSEDRPLASTEMTGPPPGARVHSAEHAVEEWSGSEREWDDFVRRDPLSTFCHLHAWRDVMTDVLGHRCHHRVARDEDGRIVGLLPLVEVRSLIFGHYLVSMPFLNYGGPLGRPTVRTALATASRDLARDLGVDLLELRSRQAVPGVLDVTHRKVTVILDLPPEPDQLWTDLPGKVRSQVRRPRKAGMEARTGPDQLDAFYDVFRRHMRDLGTPVLPYALFERLRDDFGNSVVFSAVYLGSDPVAVGCGFVHHDEYEMTWASALRDHSRQAPNMLVYWSCMEEAIRRGCTRFNFGRCTPDSGTHRFKSQWGGEDVPLPWAKWSAGGVDATPTPDGSAYRLAVSVWQRLPLMVTNALGPMISRSIP